ncbi:hypothetical protein IT415_03185 [bacterium]|nr:hypothetical protein [bacterium]
MDAAKKHADIKQAVLDMVTYFAVFNVPVSMERLVNYLPVRANHLAVAGAVRELILETKIQRIGDRYGLRGMRYVRVDSRELAREALLKRARRIGRFMALLPFVRAVVVVNSVAIGNVHDDSDIDLLIVTTPGRIFVAKGLLWKLSRWLRVLETEERKAGKISLGMFMTTRGVPLERDIMLINDPHLIYWLLTATPVYGAKIWAEILQTSPYVRARTPHMLWPRGGKSIDKSGWRFLDSWDDRGYRIHLKHTSQQPKNQQPAAFVRIRPDIINLHALDASERIADSYERLKNKPPYRTHRGRARRSS